MNAIRPMRLLLALCFILAACAGCKAPKRVPLKVMYAGSLIIPFEQLEKAYEAEHPDVDLLLEAHGSIQVIRHVTDIHDEVDVVVTADHALIPMLMYEVNVPETGRPYADWYVKFATNKLAIAYRPDSCFADEVNADNWPEILTRPGVRTGIADPRFDACGYRSLMIAQLAEETYDYPTLFEDWITGNLKSPVRALRQGDRLTIRVPEILETVEDGGIVMRGYSIQLIALLKAGEIDYTLAYESVLLQHGLQMVRLPDELNMGVEALGSEYGRVEVALGFKRFATVEPLFRGEPIGYGVTIPTNAPHPTQAIDFVAYLLGTKGQALLLENHQPLITTPQASNHDAMPEPLRHLCVPLP